MNLRSKIQNTRHTEKKKILKIKYPGINKCTTDLLRLSYPGTELFCVTCNFSSKWMAFVAGGYLVLFCLEEELKRGDALPILSLLVELLTSQKYFKLAEMLPLVTFSP